jgi:Tfp pilus assembly protein PilF
VLAVLAGLGVDGALRLARDAAARKRLVLGAGVALAVGAVVWIDFLGERDVDEARAAINRAVALRRAGFPAGAARELRTALRHDPSDPDAHRLAAEGALATGDVGAALRHLDAALAVAPDYVRVLLTKARTLETIGRGDEAGDLFRRAVEADPYSKEARLGYGVWFALRERWNEARAQFEAGLRIDPTDPDLRHNLGNLERRERGS